MNTYGYPGDGNLWHDVNTVNNSNNANTNNSIPSLPLHNPIPSLSPQPQYGQTPMYLPPFHVLDAPTNPLERYPETETLPTTFDPRPQARHHSPTPEQPSKRGRFGNPRKSPGRSHASPPSYRFASPQLGAHRASTSSRNKGNGSGNQGASQCDPPQKYLLEEFKSHLSGWKAIHADDGFADILDIVKENLHNTIMKYYFLTWTVAFYDRLLAEAAKVWQHRNPGKDDPMRATNSGEYYFSTNIPAFAYLFHAAYTDQVRKELRAFIIGYETHLCGSNKSKGMVVLWRPRVRSARKKKPSSKQSKPASKRRSTKVPQAHYDIIQYPESAEDIEHNRQVVQ